MRKVNPTQYFNDYHLRESLVLMFAFQSRKDVLDVVIDYAAEAVSQAFGAQLNGLSIEQIEPMPRDMQHLRFENAVVSVRSSGAESFDLTTLEEHSQLPSKNYRGGSTRSFK